MKPFLRIFCCLLLVISYELKAQDGAQMQAQSQQQQSVQQQQQIQEQIEPYSESNVKTIITIPKVSLPKLGRVRLEYLNSGSHWFSYVIDKHNEGTASLFGLVNLSLGSNQKIVIIDYVQYYDTTASNGDTIRFAAGVQLTLSVKILNSSLSVNLTNPVKAAASDELGSTQINFEVTTIGWANAASQQLLATLPTSFDIAAYENAANVITKLIAAMNQTMLVRPVVIPYTRNTGIGF
jgi:hypothetical protein